MTNPSESPLPRELRQQLRAILAAGGDIRANVDELMRQHPQWAAEIEGAVRPLAHEAKANAPGTAAANSAESELPLEIELRLADAVAGGGKIQRSALARIVEDHRHLLRPIRAWIERFGRRDTTASGHFRRVQHYLLLREIGRGAMGMVFLAWDTKLDRWVALKIMRGGWLDDDHLKSRFTREAKALARLRHPAIVPLYEVGEFEGTPFFTTELVRGLSLDRVLHVLRERGVPPQELTARDLAAAVETAGTTEPIGWGGSYVDLVCRIGIQVADALTASHQSGILHRDVKPSNIMLSTAGEVRVFDFGLAQVHTEQTLTRSGDVLGTPVYLAAELLLGRGRVSEATDVYSLGITLYEMLALRVPYEANGIEQLYRTLRNTEPTRLRQWNPEVGRDLEEIVHKAIEKEPEQRYATTQDLAADLAAYLRREPVRIGRSRWLRHTIRVLRRNGPRIVVGTAVAAAILLPILYLLGQLTRASAASVIATLESPAMQAPDDLQRLLAKADSFDAGDRQRVAALVRLHDDARSVLEDVRGTAGTPSADRLAELRRRAARIHGDYATEAARLLDRLEEGAALDSKQELRLRAEQLGEQLLRLRVENEALLAERARLLRGLTDAELAHAALRGRLTDAEERSIGLELSGMDPWAADAGAMAAGIPSEADARLDAEAWRDPIQVAERLGTAALIAPIAASPGKYGNREGKSLAQAIDAGLAWLAAHQDEDGKWDCDGFMKHDSADSEICDGPGNAVHDVGVTGLALLAFLDADHSMRAGPYRENVKKAVLWLRSQQQENGLFGTNAAYDFIYDHAIASLAVVEAYGRSRFRLLRPCAQRAINYLESHRNPYSVWRYQPRDNDNDLSVSGWCILTYESAAAFGLEVNKNALSLATTFLDQVSDPSGRHGYTKQGEEAARIGPGGRTMPPQFVSDGRGPGQRVLQGEHGIRFPSERSESLTAVGLCCRLVLGQVPIEKPIINSAANLIRAQPPLWDDGSIDFYYWYHATRALCLFGGNHRKDWQNRLEKAVIGRQHGSSQKRNLYGSWDPVDAWGEAGGRVYATAILVSTLCALRKPALFR